MSQAWYPFYWGDYSSKTFNLTQGQHGAYMLLLREIYTTGKPIAEKDAYGVAKATLEHERENVDYVLNRYFFKKGGWQHEKANEVMQQADEKHRKAVESGKRGAKKRHGNPIGTLEQPYSEPIVTTTTTTIDTEIEIPPAPIANDFHLPGWVPVSEWDDYLNRRARLPGADNSKASLNALVAKLMNLQMMGHDPREILIEATAGGWKTLHPPKGNLNGNANNNPNGNGAARFNSSSSHNGAVGSRSIHQPSKAAGEYRDKVLANIVREREAGRNSEVASTMGSDGIIR